MTNKRRNVFGSSRQRREGIELAAYPLPKNFGLPDKPSHTSNTSIATTVAKAMELWCNSPKRVAQVALPVLPRKKSEDEIIRSTARAPMRKGANVSITNNNTTTTAPVPMPGAFVRDRRRSSERSLTHRGIQPPPAEQCPHCERCFGIKAYDRHVEWCKEKALQSTIKQMSTKVEENIAKACLEARTKYKAPCVKSKRTLNREKYADFNGEEATNETNENPKSLDSNGANYVNAAEINANSNSENIMAKSMTSSMASESSSNRKFQNPSGNCNEATNRIPLRHKSTIPQHNHYNKHQEREEENGAVVQETVANFQFEMPDFHQHLNERNKKSKMKLTKSKTAIATNQMSSVSGLNALKSKLIALKCEEELKADNFVNNDYASKKEYGEMSLRTLRENKMHYKDGEGSEGDEQHNLPNEDLNISTGLTLYAKKKLHSDETRTFEEKPSILKNTKSNIKMTMEEFFDKDDFLKNAFIPSRTPSPKKSIHFKNTEILNVVKVLGKSGNKSDFAALHTNREEETAVENIDQSLFLDHILMGSPSQKKRIRQSSLTRPKTPHVGRDNQEYTDENDGIRVLPKLPILHISCHSYAEDVRSFSPSKKQQLSSFTQIDETFLVETDVTQVVSKLSTPEMSRHASTEDVQLCSPSKKSSFSQARKTFLVENEPTQSTEYQSNVSPTKSHRSYRQYAQEKSNIQLNKNCESTYATKDESSLPPTKNYKPNNDFVESKIPKNDKQLTENKNELSDFEENNASYHPKCRDDNVKRSDSMSTFVIQKEERRTNDEENQSQQYMKTPRTSRCGTMERDYPETTTEKQKHQSYHYIKTPRTTCCSATETEYNDQHLSSPTMKDFGSSPEKISKYQKTRNDTQTKLSARSRTVNEQSYSEEPANSKKHARLHRTVKETSKMVSSSSDSENSKEKIVKRKQLTRNCTSSSPHKKITSGKSKVLNLLETQSSKERRHNYKGSSSERPTESSKVDLQKTQSKMTFVISITEERDKSNASTQRSELECCLSEKEERAIYYNAPPKSHRAIIKGVDSKESLSEKAVNLSSKRSATELIKKIPQPLHAESNFTKDNCSPTKSLSSTFKKEERKREKEKSVSRKIDFGDDSPGEHEESSPIKRRQLRKEGSPKIQMNRTEKGEHFTGNVACAPYQLKGRADSLERTKLQNEKVHNNQMRKTESVESLSKNICVSCQGKGRVDSRERSRSQNDRGPKYQMRRIESGENLSENQPKGRDYSQERSQLINERCQMRRTESGESLSEIVARAPCQLQMRSESQDRSNKQRINVESNAEKKMLPKRSFSEIAALLNKIKPNHSKVKCEILEDFQTSTDSDNEDDHIVIRYPPIDKNQTEEESMDFETSLKALNSTEEIPSLIPHFRKCSPQKKLNRSLKESSIENKCKTAPTKKPAGRSNTPRATSKTRVVRPSTPPPPPPKQSKVPSNTSHPLTPPLTSNTSLTLLSGQTKLETSPKKSLTFCRPTRKKLPIRSSASSTTSLPMKSMPIKSMEVCSATLAPHIKNTICQNRITDVDNLGNIDNTDNYMEDRVAEADRLEITVIKEPPKLRRDESFTLRTSKKMDSNTSRSSGSFTGSTGGNLKTVNSSTPQKTSDNGQKCEIFISFETDQNVVDRAALAPNALRNMVENSQTVVEVEMDAHDNKFSKISDDDMPADSISRNSSQIYVTKTNSNSNHLPNVQVNNAKNLKQKMSNEKETDSKHADKCGAAAAAAVRPSRKVSKANKATATPNGDAYADSDELSSLDGYPLSSPHSTKAVSSKTSADSAYGSLSRQISSESTSIQHPTFNSRARSIGNSMRPMTEEFANALPTNSYGNMVTTRPSQLSVSSNSSSEYTLPPIDGYNNNAHNNTNNNYNLLQLYPLLNNNDLYDDELNNNNIEVAGHPSTAMPTPAVVHHSGLSTPLKNSSQMYNSNSTISTSMKMSKFCHECGSKFIVDQAKFCMDCGVRRIVL